MNEKLKISKVGKHEKFGEWLLVDDGSEKGSFRGTTSQVAGFLSKQIPCEIEVESVEDIENRKDVITRVKVIQKSAIAQKQEFKQANNYVPQQNQCDNRQESIVNQFCIREGLQIIKIFNEMSEEKIKPTMSNILTNAEIIKEVYSKLINPKKFPDY